MIHRVELDGFFIVNEPEQVAPALRDRGIDPDRPYRKFLVPNKDAVWFEQDLTASKESRRGSPCRASGRIFPSPTSSPASACAPAGSGYPARRSMKIRKLTRTSGQAIASKWPPKWGGSYKTGDEFPHGDEGILKSVERLGDHLRLTITYEGREQSASLQWDAPPSLDDVEKVLKAHLDQPIKAIGDLDV